MKKIFDRGPPDSNISSSNRQMHTTAVVLGTEVSSDPRGSERSKGDLCGSLEMVVKIDQFKCKGYAWGSTTIGTCGGGSL